MNDLISVIVPIYGVEAYLEQCIQSICDQTYRNLEIILVDDGSQDKCPQICDMFAGKDARIKVIHKQNGGLDNARKAGILAATGKYIGYVDGDDWIEPQMYETLLKYAQQYEVDVVESGVLDSYENGETRRFPWIEAGCYKQQDFVEKVEPRLIYSGSFFQNGVLMYLVTKLFLREKVLKYQMKQDICNMVQDDMMVSMPSIAEAKSLYITHECFYHYRVRLNSLKREVREQEVEWYMEGYPQFGVRFQSMSDRVSMQKQLDYYSMYYLLLKAPYVFDCAGSENYLTPFGKIGRDKKLVLYGAGAAGIHLHQYIQHINPNSLVYWADRNYEELQEMYDVSSPQGMKGLTYDYVILSILRDKASQSAKRDLIDLGVPESKILWIEEKYIENPRLLLQQANYHGKKMFP